MPSDVEWIKNSALKIYPQNNLIALDNGSNLEYAFEAVKGLSLSDINSRSGNICSIYTLDGAIKTNTLMEKFAQNGGNRLFVDQKTRKCKFIY